ncbi:MAG: hypothetical protein PHZ25_02140 [Candidatus Pacebacteria bacterium]|nr:hypothetical protein [Candidatus Paceibacterota bacterium]
MIFYTVLFESNNSAKEVHKKFEEWLKEESFSEIISHCLSSTQTLVGGHSYYISVVYKKKK